MHTLYKGVRARWLTVKPSGTDPGVSGTPSVLLTSVSLGVSPSAPARPRVTAAERRDWEARRVHVTTALPLLW